MNCFLILCYMLCSTAPTPLFEKLPLAARISKQKDEMKAQGIPSVYNNSLEEVNELVQKMHPGEQLCLFYFPKESEHWQLCSNNEAMTRLEYIEGIEKLGCSKLEVTFFRNLAFYPNQETLREEIQNEPELWKTAQTLLNDEESIISYKVLRIILQK